MLVLESLMREVGGDKMKGLVQDVTNLQSDTVALWKENARMVIRPPIPAPCIFAAASSQPHSQPHPSTGSSCHAIRLTAAPGR
jgi:hypothetical protein